MADFQFFHNFIFTNESAKSSGTEIGSQFVFFKGLNFMNDQHPRNSRNLCNSKKPTIRLLCHFRILLLFIHFFIIQNFCFEYQLTSWRSYEISYNSRQYSKSICLSIIIMQFSKKCRVAESTYKAQLSVSLGQFHLSLIHSLSLPFLFQKQQCTTLPPFWQLRNCTLSYMTGI